jgi:hypothetical protein
MARRTFRIGFNLQSAAVCLTATLFAVILLPETSWSQQAGSIREDVGPSDPAFLANRQRLESLRASYFADKNEFIKAYTALGPLNVSSEYLPIADAERYIESNQKALALLTNFGLEKKAQDINALARKLGYSASEVGDMTDLRSRAVRSIEMYRERISIKKSETAQETLKADRHLNAVNALDDEIASLDRELANLATSTTEGRIDDFLATGPANDFLAAGPVDDFLAADSSATGGDFLIGATDLKKTRSELLQERGSCGNFTAYRAGYANKSGEFVGEFRIETEVSVTDLEYVPSMLYLTSSDISDAERQRIRDRQLREVRVVERRNALADARCKSGEFKQWTQSIRRRHGYKG